MRAPTSFKTDFSQEHDPLAYNMGNIFGRETEANPPNRELLPVLRATARPFYYGRGLPCDDMRQDRGAPQAHHPRPCLFYARGTCFRKTGCRFSHETVVEIPSTVESRTPCRFFVRGYCRRGEACNFSHDQPSVRKSTEAIEVFIWSPVH